MMPNTDDLTHLFQCLHRVRAEGAPNLLRYRRTSNGCLVPLPSEKQALVQLDCVIRLIQLPVLDSAVAPQFVQKAQPPVVIGQSRQSGRALEKTLHPMDVKTNPFPRNKAAS